MIRMPALSPTMTTGTLVKWVLKENEHIKMGQILAEIETDKAIMEMESVHKGTIVKLLVEEGAKDLPVNAPIAVLALKDVNENEIDHFVNNFKDEKEVLNNTNQIVDKKITDLERVGGYKKNIVKPDIKPTIAQTRILITPYAKHLAKNMHIDHTQITGTGKKGFITAFDIENATTTSKMHHDQIQPLINESSVPLSAIRKAIAKKVMHAKQTIPHFYITTNINISNILKYKDHLFQEHNEKTTLNDWFLMGCARALIKVPALNQTWDKEGESLYQHKQVNINCAIDVGNGPLLVMLDDLQIKSLRQISAQMKNIVQKAKDNQMIPLQTGSFSISNLGMFGVAHFQAIINSPQVAMLAIGGLEPGNLCAFTLSCDHRALDGRDAAVFLQELKKLLETPIMLIV